MATQTPRTRTSRTSRTSRSTQTAAGLGTASVTEPPTSAARQARIWRETVRDLMARKSGYLLVRRYLDVAMADAAEAHYGQDRDAAQVLAAILDVRHLLDAEMERVDAQMRLVELLRAA